MAATAALLTCGLPAVRADILFLDSFKNIGYEQTGNGNSLTLNGTAFYSAEPQYV